MTTRTFMMATGLVVFGGVVLLVVFQAHGCLTERRAQRAAEEARLAAMRTRVAARLRESSLTTLVIAVNDLPSTPATETLSDKLLATMRGEGTDPKVEAMVNALLEVWHDMTLPADEKSDAIDELATKLGREYQP